MKIRSLLLVIGDLKITLEEVAIASHTMVGAVAVIVLASFLWAIS